MNHHNACEQALWGALAVGRKRKEELPTTNLEFEFHIQFSCGSPRRLSCQISANQRKAEKRSNVHVPRGNDVNTNVISANQHFASTFSMQIFKFQRRVASSPFIILSAARTARTACSRHVPNTYSSVFLIFTNSYSSTEGSATGVAV